MTGRYKCRNVTEYRGRTVSMPELAAITGILERTLQFRYSQGKRGEDLVTPSRANPAPEGGVVVTAPATESRRARELAKREQLKAEIMALGQVRIA